MKKMMIMGGLVGFGIGVVTGLVKEITWPALFLRACVALLVFRSVVPLVGSGLDQRIQGQCRPGRRRRPRTPIQTPQPNNLNGFTPASTLRTPPKPRVGAKNLSRYGRIVPGSTAEDELVQQHLPLVRQVVGRLAMSMPAHVDQDDLYSSGLVGLLNAVRNLRSARAAAPLNLTPASAFAARSLTNCAGSIGCPRSVHDKARKVQAVMQQLEQAQGQPPSDEEMAKALKLSVSEYHELIEEIRPATFVCLDASPVNDDDDESRHDRIADENQPDPLDCTARREVAAIIAQRITHCRRCNARFSRFIILKICDCAKLRRRSA
jgi:RNA polymerase sigma factor for flagellar operon FliA